MFQSSAKPHLVLSEDEQHWLVERQVVRPTALSPLWHATSRTHCAGVSSRIDFHQATIRHTLEIVSDPDRKIDVGLVSPDCHIRSTFFVRQAHALFASRCGGELALSAPIGIDVLRRAFIVKLASSDDSCTVVPASRLSSDAWLPTADEVHAHDALLSGHALSVEILGADDAGPPSRLTFVGPPGGRLWTYSQTDASAAECCFFQSLSARKAQQMADAIVGLP